MNLKKLNELITTSVPYHSLLAQDLSEWRIFLEFAEGYFKNRNIKNPIVVEIGLMHNAQKVYYQEFLGAEHIGIDINMNCNPDILGDSHKIKTVEMLKARLDRRQIDLLFIDGNHSYDSVRKDYELYEPLTKYLVAFHDISATVNSDVMRFWQEISRNNQYMSIAFNKHNSLPYPIKNKFVDMGIGVIIKE